MNKIALVTGGNSGIGFATAKLLKEKGYAVVISGRHAGRVQEAAKTIGVEGVVADMANPEDLKKLAAGFSATGLDVLVNNAAIAKMIPIGGHQPEDYTAFFDTNLRGPLELIRELLPALEKRQGSISNISSVVVTNGLPNASLYAATKGGMDAFTRSLARELAPRGIRINAVSPGAIDTPIRNKVGLSKEELEESRAKHEANIPLGRYGRPEEVAHVIVAQLEATYVTGSIWIFDGGVDAC